MVEPRNVFGPDGRFPPADNPVTNFTSSGDISANLSTTLGIFEFRLTLPGVRAKVTSATEERQPTRHRGSRAPPTRRRDSRAKRRREGRRESRARDTVRRNPHQVSASGQRPGHGTQLRWRSFGSHPGPDAELPRQTQVRRGSGTSNETVQPVKTMRVDPEPTLRPRAHDFGRPSGASTFFHSHHRRRHGVLDA